MQSIRRALKTAEINTVPDFESAYIDATIAFCRDEPSKEAPPEAATPELPQHAVAEDSEVLLHATAYADPTYRLSKLAAANRPPVAVRPDSTLPEAVTVMMTNQFSQLPVMTSEREIKGIVSWRTIGTRLALGQTPQTAHDAVEPAAEISSDASLFRALPVIVEHDYVLVRGADRRVVGIVTASDISLQFQQLAEPFLLLGEIENHLRRIISTAFKGQDLASIKDPADPARQVTSAADLTFGEYRRLLEDPGRWERTKLRIDRAKFIEMLERVRAIRNDVMHFDPDGIPPEDLAVLRDFARFLATLQTLGVT